MRNFSPAILALVLPFGLGLSSPLQAATLESIYTDLKPAKCKVTKEDVEYQESKCAGVGGYTLLSIYSDQRQSVTIVSPQGKEFPLNYWEVVTPRMMHTGDKAEWRVLKENGKVTPKALIVRVTAPAGEQSTKTKSYLAVAKITPEASCVTDRIEPGPQANEQAQIAADASAAKPCLKAQP